jgi:hypothetical protein
MGNTRSFMNKNDSLTLIIDLAKDTKFGLDEKGNVCAPVYLTNACKDVRMKKEKMDVTTVDQAMDLVKKHVGYLNLLPYEFRSNKDIVLYALKKTDKNKNGYYTGVEYTIPFDLFYNNEILIRAIPLSPDRWKKFLKYDQVFEDELFKDFFIHVSLTTFDEKECHKSDIFSVNLEEVVKIYPDVFTYSSKFKYILDNYKDESKLDIVEKLINKWVNVNNLVADFIPK